MKVTELEKRGPFSQFLISARERPECENLEFLALLILPVQRILRYKLLLDEFIKFTPETQPDHKELVLVYIYSCCEIVHSLMTNRPLGVF